MVFYSKSFSKSNLSPIPQGNQASLVTLLYIHHIYPSDHLLNQLTHVEAMNIEQKTDNSHHNYKKYNKNTYYLKIIHLECTFNKNTHNQGLSFLKKVAH